MKHVVARGYHVSIPMDAVSLHQVPFVKIIMLYFLAFLLFLHQKRSYKTMQVHCSKVSNTKINKQKSNCYRTKYDIKLKKKFINSLKESCSFENGLLNLDKQNQLMKHFIGFEANN